MRVNFADYASVKPQSQTRTTGILHETDALERPLFGARSDGNLPRKVSDRFAVREDVNLAHYARLGRAYQDIVDFSLSSSRVLLSREVPVNGQRSVPAIAESAYPACT